VFGKIVVTADAATVQMLSPLPAATKGGRLHRWQDTIVYLAGDTMLFGTVYLYSVKANEWKQKSLDLANPNLALTSYVSFV
jgi:hypothetical protein